MSTLPAGAVPLDQIDPSQVSLSPPTPPEGAIPLEQIDPAQVSTVPPGAVPLEQIDPAQVQAKPTADLLAKWPRRRIVDEAAIAKQRGEDLTPYRDAYKLRAAEGKYFGEEDNSLTPEQRAAQPGAVRQVVSAVGGFLGAFGKAGQNLYQSVRPGELTPEQRAAKLHEVAAGVQVGTGDFWHALVSSFHNFQNHGYKSDMEIGRREGFGPEWEAQRKDYYSQLWDRQFDSDLEHTEWRDKAKQGAFLSQPAGGVAPLDAQRVDEMSPALNLGNYVPLGFGVKAAGVAAGEGAAFNVLKNAGTDVGVAARASSASLRGLSKALSYSAKGLGGEGVVPAVLGAGIAAENGGDLKDVLLAGVAGRYVGKKVLASTLERGAQSTERIASALTGGPVKGPMARFAVWAAETAPREAQGLVVSQLANSPFLLGSKSREEFEGNLAASVGLHTLGRAVGGTVNGLNVSRTLFGPGDRMPETRLAAKNLGIDPNLDAAHQAVVSKLDNASNNWVEAVRSAVNKFGGELYTLAVPEYEKAVDSLVGQTAKIGNEPVQLTPEWAKTAKSQQGLSIELAQPDGSTRRLALSRVSDALPGISVGHEAGHLLESVLSPEELQHAYEATKKAFSPDDIAQYRRQYEGVANANLPEGATPVRLSDEAVLSEIFAEHASAVLNSLPIGQLTDAGKNRRGYARKVYGLVGRALEAVGAKQPKLVGGTGEVKTALGIEPSAKLSTAIENFLTARALDGFDAEASKSQTPAQQTSEKAPAGASTAGSSAGAAPQTVQNVRPAPVKQVEPGFKKGDPIGDVRDLNGVLVGEDAKVSKPLDNGNVEIEFTHPDTGERVLGEVPETWLVSPTVVGKVDPNQTVYYKGPVSPATPAGAATTLASVPEGQAHLYVDEQGRPISEQQVLASRKPAPTAEQIVAPKQVENVARPVAPSEPAGTPNLRTTPEKQRAIAGPATPEVFQANLNALKLGESSPRHERSVVETDYYAAKSPVSSPDQVVREQQRLAADAADLEAEASGKPNPLRALYQKLFVPYKLREAKSGWTVYGMSLDKVAQNLDLLRGWLRLNPEAASPKLAEYLSGPEIGRDLQTYLRNQSNGYAGDGRKLVRPDDARDITPENPNFTPDTLPQESAEVLNLLMGMEQPQTETAGQQFARRFAELNGLEPGTVDGVTDTNALRVFLRSRGFDPAILNSVVENLRVDRMTTPLKERKDLNFPAGDSGIQRAGFMPATPPTGWVLPNGEYEGMHDPRGVFQNTGDFHLNKLRDNRTDYEKRFGLAIDDNAPEDARLSALQRGFVRVRYDARSGRLGVEAAQKHWGGSRLAKVGRGVLADELATRPIRTQRYNPATKSFDEFTVENNKAILRRAAGE